MSSCDTGHATGQLPTPLNACSLKGRLCAVPGLSPDVTLISREEGLLLITPGFGLWVWVGLVAVQCLVLCWNQNFCSSA